jgi:5-bromo-4-chloroindolyl phosphate hydrolysis protein
VCIAKAKQAKVSNNLWRKPMLNELEKNLEVNEVEVESQEVNEIDFSNNAGKTAPEF